MEMCASEKNVVFLFDARVEIVIWVVTLNLNMICSLHHTNLYFLLTIHFFYFYSVVLTKDQLQNISPYTPDFSTYFVAKKMVNPQDNI